MKRPRVLITISILLLLLFSAFICGWIRGKRIVVRTYFVPASFFENNALEDTGGTAFPDDPEEAHKDKGAANVSEDTEDQPEIQTPSSEKLRIAALADLHGELTEKDRERIVSYVHLANPDIIVYLGDMVEKHRVEESTKTIADLTKQLTETAPVYYVDGNHEQSIRENTPQLYESLNEALSEAGAVQLENEIIRLSIGHEIFLNLCGVSTHYLWGEKESGLVNELRTMPGVNVLLCHYPESVIWYKAFNGGGLDAALCGHTHGGLIRFPFAGGLFAPEQGWLPEYDLGAYPFYTAADKQNHRDSVGTEYLGTMIISGGLAGEHGVPRINNPREISIIEFGK